jgi:hypothetical protein
MRKVEMKPVKPAVRKAPNTVGLIATLGGKGTAAKDTVKGPAGGSEISAGPNPPGDYISRSDRWDLDLGRKVDHGMDSAKATDTRFWEFQARLQRNLDNENDLRDAFADDMIKLMHEAAEHAAEGNKKASRKALDEALFAFTKERQPEPLARDDWKLLQYCPYVGDQEDDDEDEDGDEDGERAAILRSKRRSYDL